MGMKVIHHLSKQERVERYIRKEEDRVAHYLEMIEELGGGHRQTRQARHLLKRAEKSLEAFRRELARIQARQ